MYNRYFIYFFHLFPPGPPNTPAKSRESIRTVGFKSDSTVVTTDETDEADSGSFFNVVNYHQIIIWILISLLPQTSNRNDYLLAAATSTIKSSTPKINQKSCVFVAQRWQLGSNTAFFLQTWWKN